MATALKALYVLIYDGGSVYCWGDSVAPPNTPILYQTKAEAKRDIGRAGLRRTKIVPATEEQIAEGMTAEYLRSI